MKFSVWIKNDTSEFASVGSLNHASPVASFVNDLFILYWMVTVIIIKTHICNLTL